MKNGSLARRKRFSTLIVAVAAILILAGVLLLAAYFYLQHAAAHRNKAATGEKVTPAIALRVLAGEPAGRTADIAISRNDLATARLVIRTDPFMSGKDQLGLRLRIAHAYAGRSGNALSEEADAVYKEAAAIAFLSPDLTDLTRAQALLEIGTGYIGMKSDEEAMEVIAGAQELAYHSPYLNPAQRVQLVQRLRQMHKSMGKEVTLKNPPVTPASTVQSLPVPLHDEVPLAEPAELIAAKSSRMSAVARALESGQGWDAVAAALEKEDEVRTKVYQRVLSNTPQMAVRASWMRDRVRWLQIKLLVAQKAFGKSLVPSWESQSADIRFRLTKAYEDLFAAYGDQAVALPSPTAVEAGWVEVLREELMDGWLGYYPEAPMGRIESDLRSHLKNLGASGDKGLYPYVDLKGESSIPFRFAPAGAG